MIGDWTTIPDCIDKVSGVPTLSCVPPLLQTIVFWLLTGAGIVAFFMLIFAGFKFINSGGDPKAVEGARKTITYALIGLILIFASFVIMTLIGHVTGVSSLTDFKFK